MRDEISPLLRRRVWEDRARLIQTARAWGARGLSDTVRIWTDSSGMVHARSERVCVQGRTTYGTVRLTRSTVMCTACSTVSREGRKGFESESTLVAVAWCALVERELEVLDRGVRAVERLGASERVRTLFGHHLGEEVDEAVAAVTSERRELLEDAYFALLSTLNSDEHKEELVSPLVQEPQDRDVVLMSVRPRWNWGDSERAYIMPFLSSRWEDASGEYDLLEAPRALLSVLGRTVRDHVQLESGDGAEVTETFAVLWKPWDEGGAFSSMESALEAARAL